MAIKLSKDYSTKNAAPVQLMNYHYLSSLVLDGFHKKGMFSDRLKGMVLKNFSGPLSLHALQAIFPRVVLGSP